MESVARGRECEEPSRSGRWRAAVLSADSPSFALCLLCLRECLKELSVGDLSVCYKGHVLVFPSWKRPGRSLACSSLEHSQILILEDIFQIFIPEQPRVVQAVLTSSGF